MARELRDIDIHEIELRLGTKDEVVLTREEVAALVLAFRDTKYLQELSEELQDKIAKKNKEIKRFSDRVDDLEERLYGPRSA